MAQIKCSTELPSRGMPLEDSILPKGHTESMSRLEEMTVATVVLVLAETCRVLLTCMRGSGENSGKDPENKISGGGLALPDFKAYCEAAAVEMGAPETPQ